MEKSVFQTNDTKKHKPQGTECQGPGPVYMYLKH